MIIVPKESWSGADSDDIGTSLLTGAPASLPLGTFRLPNDPHLIATVPPDDDPVTRADAMRERAGQVFQRHRAIGAFNRELDELFTNVAEGTDWSGGLGKFDREIGSLRQKHGAALRSAEDRAAFERHADEFGAMQRINLKRALVERQQADALALLNDQLTYYSSKAADAPNEVFREIAVDAGLRAIEEQRDAGYLFPEGAKKLEAQFLARVDTANDWPPPPLKTTTRHGTIGSTIMSRTTSLCRRIRKWIPTSTLGFLPAFPIAMFQPANQTRRRQSSRRTSDEAVRYHDSRRR